MQVVGYTAIMTEKKTKQNKIENNEQPIIPPLAPGSPMNYRAPEAESPSF